MNRAEEQGALKVAKENPMALLAVTLDAGWGSFSYELRRTIFMTLREFLPEEVTGSEDVAGIQ